jgi:hypothetical protein
MPLVCQEHKDGQLVRVTHIDTTQIDLDLEGCRVKLDRAHGHFEELRDRLIDFFNAHPYRSLGKLEGNTGWYVFRLAATRQPSPEVGVVLGECVHQLRSTLDHFAWALASYYPPHRRPRENFGWPIETSSRKYANQVCRKHLADFIPADWLAFIECSQPYNRQPQSPATASLAILDRYWNTDKHQIVIPLGIGDPIRPATLFEPVADVEAFGEIRDRARVRLEHGAEITRVRITPNGTHPEVRMDALLGIHVEEQGRGLLEALSEAATFIDCLVASFESGWPPRQFARGEPFYRVQILG